MRVWVVREVVGIGELETERMVVRRRRVVGRVGSCILILVVCVEMFC